MCESSGYSICLPTFGAFSLFNFDHVSTYVQCVNVIFIRIFLMTEDVEHFILILVFSYEVSEYFAHFI